MTTSVSVVIPTFERASLLEGVIQELLIQPLKEIEILVMDDGSRDDTEQRIRAFTDPRVIYRKFDKIGIPAIVNLGIERCTSPYIMFLHDHDKAHTEMLLALRDALDRNESASFAFCGYEFFDSNLESKQEHWLLDLPEFNRGPSFLETVLMPRINCPVLAVSMVRTSALSGELLDETFGGCADVELWHRLAARSDVVYVPRTLIDIRGRSESSQFSSASKTFQLMSSSAELKHKFLEKIPLSSRNAIRNGWRHQIDQGCVYIAWKALEQGDTKTLSELSEYVATNGSWVGIMALTFLKVLPLPFARGLLRLARKSVVSRPRSTA